MLPKELSQKISGCSKKVKNFLEQYPDGVQMVDNVPIRILENEFGFLSVFIEVTENTTGTQLESAIPMAKIWMKQ